MEEPAELKKLRLGKGKVAFKLWSKSLRDEENLEKWVVTEVKTRECCK